MVEEKKNVALNDGADEQMLGTGGPDDKLSEHRDEVKFIKGGDHQNGDAKIDIGNVNGGKPTFTGMSKEELMKYANDPFWVRLRWIFFVGFWSIWVGMLVGAILIIVGAPKCSAPQPLAWYKQGPHAKFSDLNNAKPEDLQLAKKIHATGAIYELPAALTYDVKNPEVEEKIKQLVANYKNSDIKVILDLTPNVVTQGSKLFKDAMEDKNKRSAFVWKSDLTSAPTTWLKVKGSTSAWDQVNGSYVLSQFDGFYDLKMNSSLVREEFGGVLKHLVELGVQGIRLNNTKYFVLYENLENEDIPSSNNLNAVVGEYDFFLHDKTTFHTGLGDVLYDYLSVVKNASADAFLTVSRDIEQPEKYQLSKSGGALGIDVPLYGGFVEALSKNAPQSLRETLNSTLSQAGNGTWLQWDFGKVYLSSNQDHSAMAYVLSLLPGVPVVPVDSDEYLNVTEATYNHIEHLRKSASYMHGEFKLYKKDPLLVYSRIKSGNPGYFVIFNPSDQTQSALIEDSQDLPEKMTVSLLSENYNTIDISNNNNISSLVVHPVGSKVTLKDVAVAPHSTIILTYVPV
ncbi:amino acid transporter heavy chain SLC3A1 [Drosophila tropicalis]|uniref:amino acid transporter heavy chain SLC3A1 n=1 Tax=Drosophila tropicalis TaxID=46794 RepID=UPI0035ABDF73